MTFRRPAVVLTTLAALALSGCAVTPPVSTTAPSTTAPITTAPRADSPRTTAATTAEPTTAPAAAPGTVTCEYRPGGTPAKPVDPPSGTDVPATGTAHVTIDLGDAKVEVELDRGAAPCTVHSFESLAAQGYYDGSECHRLSTQGMSILQCGDPTGTGSGGPGYTFDDEVDAGTRYPAGVLAMANRGPDTNGSQFFFVFGDTNLPPNYTVFGRLDAASNQVIADRAFQGHDSSYPDGTGRPNLPTVIRSVVSG